MVSSQDRPEPQATDTHAVADVLPSLRKARGLSQTELAQTAGLSLRQVNRYEAGDQQPTFAAAIALAKALEVSLDRLAGQVDYELDLSGDWWCGWQTRKDGVPRTDTHSLDVAQRGQVLLLNAERALPMEEGSYRWRGELRIWDQESLIGWYRSTDPAVRSKGSMYLALHPHGTHAWGRWVGMSYDGLVITGWGAMARTQEQTKQVIQDLLDTESSPS